MTCYDGTGSELADSQCSGSGSGSKPATVQTCADCSAEASPGASAAAAAAPDGGSASSSGGSGFTGTTLIIVAVAAGAAVAAAAAAAGFLLFRRSQRKRVEDRSLGARPGPHPPASHMAPAKWSSDEGVGADAIDVIPLPKHLRPIATGRSSRRSPRLQQAGGGAQHAQHLAAAAGDVAAAALQQQVAAAAHGQMGYAQAAAQPQYGPDYHVVHMPSPRLTGGAVAGAVGRCATRQLVHRAAH